MKKNQMEVLEMKNTILEIKFTEGFNSWIEISEGNVSELEDRATEMK